MRERATTALHRRRRTVAALAGLAVALLLAASALGPRAFSERDPAVEPMRGVCFVAGGPVEDAHLRELQEMGVDWISLTPFGWQRRVHDPTFRIVTDGRVYWGERDRGLRETARLARARGIRTLLKPHLWLMDRSDGKWEGDIAMHSEEDWRRWFETYERFILHYARLAEGSGMEALSIGTELQGTTHRTAEWRRIIARVRRAYGGRLTYSANWSGEFEQIGFWDDLDFIGVQAYFPLADTSDASPSIDALVAAWEPHAGRIAALSRRFGKPVVFTEIGYRSTEGAGIEPWLWRTPGPVNHGEQDRLYEAFFRALWDEPWMGGVYWWKWFPHWDERRSARDGSFTPQGKRAARSLAEWYRGTKGTGSGGGAAMGQESDRRR